MINSPSPEPNNGLRHYESPLFRSLLLTALMGCSATVANTPTPDAGNDSGDTNTADAADIANDVDQSLRVHLYATSLTTFPGNPIGLFANVTIGNNRVLTDNIGRLAIGGGDGNIGTRPYGRTNSDSLVMMDHVCIETSGTHAQSGIYEQRTSGNWNTVSVQSQPCDTSHQLDTGWSVAQFYAPTAISSAQMNFLNVTVLNRADQPMMARTITVDEMARGSNVTITPATPALTQGSNFFAIVTAIDSSQPIVCSIAGLPTTSNGEDGVTSGCNTDLNGPMNEWVRPQTAMNRTNYSEGWALYADQITGCTVWSRGYGTVEASVPLTLTNLGAGMFLLAGTANTPGTCHFAANLNGRSEHYQSNADLTVR